MNVEACGLPLPEGEIKNLDDGYGRLCIMITPLSFSGEQATVPGGERHCSKWVKGRKRAFVLVFKDSGNLKKVVSYNLK